MHRRFRRPVVIKRQAIERLRARAARYRREAAQAKTRALLLYYRALAAHLEREASELECLTESDAPSMPEAASSQADG